MNSSCQSNWGDSLGTGVIIVQGAFRLARQPVWLERGEEGGGLGWRGLGPGGWDWARRGLLVPKGHRESRKGASEAELAKPGEGLGEFCKSWGLRRMPDVPLKITKYVILY